MRVRFVAAIGLSLLLGHAIPAFARPQEGPPAEDPQQSHTPAPTSPPQIADAAVSAPTPPVVTGAAESHLVDVGDLWHHVRHVTPQAGTPSGYAPVQTAKHPFFFFSPSFSSKPSTGFSAGLASSIVFVAGDPATTHISSGDWSVSASAKGQFGTSVRFRIFTPENRWLFQGDDRLAWTSQTTYALGIVPDAIGEHMKYDRTRVYETVYRRVRSKMLVGAGLSLNSHSNIRPSTPGASYEDSAYVAYSAEHGFAIDQQQSNGVSFNVLVDTRNNAINATRGWLASATYRTFLDGFFGGSSTWQRLETEARTYKAFDRERQTIAVWFLGEFVTGGVAPYFDLPSIADDTYGRSARGYTTGRYRGPHLVYGEVEYRAALMRNKLLGGVLFANATAVDDTSGQQPLFSTVAPAAGAGLRLLVSKRSLANLCVDYGWGRDGSRGFYLAMRETF